MWAIGFTAKPSQTIFKKLIPNFKNMISIYPILNKKIARFFKNRQHVHTLYNRCGILKSAGRENIKQNSNEG